MKQVSNQITDLPISVVRLRFLPKDTVIIGAKSSAVRQCLTVVSGVKGGYMLRTPDNQQTVWSDHLLFSHYQKDEIEYLPTNVSGLSDELEALVNSDFEAWPERERLMARFREAYCRIVQRLLKEGYRKEIAYRRAASQMPSDEFDRWSAEFDAVAWKQILTDERKLAREGEDISRKILRPKPLKAPSWSSVRNWFLRWEKCSFDHRALLPQNNRKGNRNPRYPDLRCYQSPKAPPLCVYGAMHQVAENTVMKLPRVTMAYGYTELTKVLAEHKLPIVSEACFRDFIHRTYSDFEEYAKRYGKRAARFRFDIFERRPLPDRPLECVEIDHTLIDVKCRIKKRKRVLRAWLTVLIDRCTKIIVGIHLSFDDPSDAVVQRAMLHAMCVKDLSPFPDVKNEWPTHGRIECLVTDRGQEFLSASFHSACERIGTQVINLPGRHPHWKASVERFFLTLNGRVFDPMEGSTKSQSIGVYDAHKRANLSLKEINAELVKFIVDDYHCDVHPTTGQTPLNRWNELVAVHGIMPAPNFQHLLCLTGKRAFRVIGNFGIQLHNLNYASAGLQELRRRRGGRNEAFEIRFDPYDMDQIYVLDKKSNQFLRVPLASKVYNNKYNLFAIRKHRELARTLVPKGADITDAVMKDAIERCDQEVLTTNHDRAAERYLAEGTPCTPLWGHAEYINDPDSPSKTDKAKDNKVETTPLYSSRDDTLIALLSELAGSFAKESYDEK